MKSFTTTLLITLSLLFTSYIKMNADENSWNKKNDRSISLFLCVEENNLYIHSTTQWDHIGIQVIDPDGETIYMDIIAIPAEEELIIPFTYLPEGNYQVILTKDNQPVTWYLEK